MLLFWMMVGGAMPFLVDLPEFLAARRYQAKRRVECRRIPTAQERAAKDESDNRIVAIVACIIVMGGLLLAMFS